MTLTRIKRQSLFPTVKFKPARSTTANSMYGPVHNPANVPETFLEPEKGWRFLCEDEVYDDHNAHEMQILVILHNNNPCWSVLAELTGSNKEATYRTRLPYPIRKQLTNAG